MASYKLYSDTNTSMVFCDFDESVDNHSADFDYSQLYYDDYYDCYCLDNCQGYDIYLAHFIQTYITRIVTPIICIFGFIGNGLILLMFLHKDLATMPSKAFFIALALADTSLLVASPLVDILEQIIQVTFVNNRISCTIVSFMVFVSTYCSAWFVACLTADRFICIQWPLKSHLIRTRHRLLVIAVIFSFIFAINAHMLVYVIYDEHFLLCRFSHDVPLYKEFSTLYWPWLDLTVYFLIPLSVIILCNVGMVHNITQQKEIDVNSTKAENLASKKLTRLFIVVSTAFVVLVLPTSVYTIYDYYLFYYTIATKRTNASLDLVYIITYNLQMVNHSINILLYCLSGAKFRSVFMDVGRCRFRT